MPCAWSLGQFKCQWGHQFIYVPDRVHTDKQDIEGVDNGQVFYDILIKIRIEDKMENIFLYVIADTPFKNW